MDASTGLGQGNETNANQQQGEEHEGMEMLQQTVPQLVQTKGAEPFLWNESLSF